MHYRTHKGEHLSVLGLGCYALSGAYGQKDPQEFVAVVHRAYDLGVILFDTADIYGPAEEILGQAVAPFREQVWIASKVGASPDGKPDCSAEHVLASCEESLRRLQTDRIDLYQVHFNDPRTPVEETVAALEELRAAGKIRHYGVGHLPPQRLQEYVAAGELFSVLTELSAVSRGALRRTLPLCRAHDVAVLAFSVTGRGLLTGKIGPGYTFEEGDIRRLDALFQRERFASGLRVLERFRDLGQKHGRSPVQAAIAWVLAQPGVCCALTGPSSIAHLEENLGGADWTMDPSELKELEQFFQEEDQRLHQEQLLSVHTILEQDLGAQSAFTDLVYVLETLAEMGLAAEEEVLPFFRQLLALRGQDDAAALAEIQTIQRELGRQFLQRIP